MCIRDSIDTGKRTEQRRFPCAVMPDQAQAISAFQLEIDVAQRLNDRDASLFTKPAARYRSRKRFFQRRCTGPINRKVDSYVFE